MKISVLSYDLSHNCAGRALVLAELLDRHHEVELIGPTLGDGLWEPLPNDIPIRSIDASSRIWSFPTEIKNVMNLISGDIIYASKPRGTGFGVSLLYRQLNNTPVVIDIDDWETGFLYSKNSFSRTYLFELLRLIDVNSFYYTRALEELSSCVDGMTVSNSFLKNRFGGKIIPHARDERLFNPKKYSGQDVRNELNISSDDFICLFLGTPRRHKGIEIIIEAVSGLNQPNIKLLIVGADDSLYSNKIRETASDRIIICGQKPFREIPKWLAAADSVLIPQKKNQSTVGQVPAKVFDAMAMAKPVITTQVSDLPMIVGRGGYIVPPDSVSEFQKKILRLYNSPELRRRIGEEGRKRFVTNYSYKSLSSELSEYLLSLTS